MAKYCSIEGCERKVWSKGKCIIHQDKKPLKQGSKQLKSTKRLRAKPKSKERVQEEKEQKDKMWEIFLQVWKEREHNCQSCNKFLGNISYSWMFDHIIEKSVRKDLKYEKENIVLVCMECHDKKTRGFINNKYKEIIEKAKELFDI